MSLPLHIQAAMGAWQRVLPEREWLAANAWLATLYPFQLAWVLDEAKFGALVKARQIGASHSWGAWAVLRALIGEPTTIISIGEREAEEVLDKCRKHADMLMALGSAWAKHTSKEGELRFHSGGRILALPSSSGARGYSSNAILDEFAYTGLRARAIWDAASASVMHGFKLRVLSTPNGAAGQFYTLITDSRANKDWTIWRTTIHDAIADGMRISIDECWRMARNDPRVFRQLFECDFLSSDEQYLLPEIVEPCILGDDDPGANHHELQGRLRYFGGIDVGLVNDLTAIATVAQDPRTNRCWLVDMTTCARTAWEKQQVTIEAFDEHYAYRRLFVDETGLGAVPVQLLRKRIGYGRVDGIPFTTKSKGELATGLHQALADQMLRIPNDRLLVSDLYRLKRIVTPAGSVKFDADHDENGHADRAWALALAIAAVNAAAGATVFAGYDVRKKERRKARDAA